MLNNCDCLVTGVSTTAIEAMSKNIPAISIDFYKEYKNEYMIKNRFINYCNNKELLKKMIKEKINLDKKGEGFSKEYFGLNKNPLLELNEILEL